MTDVTIRRAEQADLPALLDIYNHYILTTPITFDIEPRTLAQRQAWLNQFSASGKYQCFAVARAGKPVGWVCSTQFKEKAAYATTIETSVYLAPEETGARSRTETLPDPVRCVAWRRHPPRLCRSDPAERRVFRSA